MTRYLRLTLGVLVSAVCLILAFRGVQFGELWRRAHALRIPLVALSMAVGSVSLLLRGARWKVLLTSSAPIPFSTVFAVNTAGQLGNNILPARLGDVFRATNLTRSGISSGFSLATIFVERVLDTGFLVLVASAALRSVGTLPPWLMHASSLMAFAALGGLVFALSLPLLEEHLLKIVRRVLPPHWRSRAALLVEQFALGLRSLHSVRTVLLFLLLTAVIWSLDGLGIWIFAGATGLNLSAAVIAVFITAVALASAIPAAPGNAGVYQAVAVAVLAPFGASHAAALFFALTWQVFMVMSLVLWGLGSLWFLASRRLLITAGFRRRTPVPAADLVVP